MGNFTIESCPLEGVKIIHSRVFTDDRGHFLETYNKKAFEEIGIYDNFVQDNQSASKHGVLRGMHFQKMHPQSKLVSCLAGEIFDVVVDLRKDSKTFGKWFGITLSEQNHTQIYIPVGFAHGYYVISESAVFSYKCGDFYCPGDEGGISWDDPDVNIEWPIPEGETPITLPRDSQWPSIRSL